ncbi:MAG: AMP-dependent synthetase, partial [Alphaproteobacteria bacterium]|nr:AMP-dependent synthetase [Alphaproteobacteria bacterium]
MAAQTVIELLSVGADSDTAISAVDRPPLTYAGLRALVAETVASLRRLGIGRNDRVAIVLPNGPEMAAA